MQRGGQKALHVRVLGLLALDKSTTVQILTLQRRTDSAARRGGKGQGKACASVARIQRQHAAARQDRTQRRKACCRCKVSSVRICTFVPVFCTSEDIVERKKKTDKDNLFPRFFSVQYLRTCTLEEKNRKKE